MLALDDTTELYDGTQLEGAYRVVRTRDQGGTQSTRLIGTPATLPKVSGLQPEVEAVLRRALSKNRDGRFARVTDFSRALKVPRRLIMEL